MPEARKDVLLYKRHTPACERSLSNIPPAKRRYHMKCDCTIWATGQMPNGDFLPRRSTYCTDEASARAYMAAAIEEHLPEDYVSTDPRLDLCIKRFVESKKPPEFSDTTHRHTRDYLGLLQQFCEQKRIVYMRQLSVDIIDDFRNIGLKDAAYKDSTIGEIIKKVRAFLREAYRRSWIAEPLGDKVKRHYVEEGEQAAPFEDEQVPMILNCRMKAYRTGYARFPETFRLLIELMLETGLRISDACLYDPAKTRREGDEWEYDYIPRKTRKKKIGLMIARHQVYLSNRLKVAIDNSRWHSKDLPFVYASRPFEKLAQAAYSRMQSIGDRAGVAGCRPHRCRDTFAVRLLTKGIQLDDVSRLLGHRSVLVTQAHYNRWIPKRAVRLAGIARSAHVGFDLQPDVLRNPQDGVLLS